MKTAALLVPALFILATSNAEDIAYEPADGSRVTRTFSSSGRYTFDEVTLEVDGEEMGGIEADDLTITSAEFIAVTDTIVSVDAGLPTTLERTFDELTRDVNYALGGDARPEHSISDLEGVTVRFEYDGEGTYAVEFSNDLDLDEELLAGLLEDMDFRRVLPTEAVEEGDTWEIAGRTYLGLMSPCGVLSFYVEGEDSVDPLARAADMQMIASMDGSGSAELIELRGLDSERLAVIHLEWDVTSSATTAFETEDGAAMSREIRVEREAEGELWWNLEHGILHSIDIEADAVLTIITRGGGADVAGVDHEIVETRTYTGTIEYEVTVEIE